MYETLGFLCGRAFAKKRRSSAGGKGENNGSLKDIYTQMFKYHHLLPDEVGRQDPKMLFELIDGLNDDNDNSKYAEIPKGLEFFYGK